MATAHARLDGHTAEARAQTPAHIRALALAAAAIAVHYTDTDRISRFAALGAEFAVVVEPDEPVTALAERHHPVPHVRSRSR